MNSRGILFDFHRDEKMGAFSLFADGDIEAQKDYELLKVRERYGFPAWACHSGAFDYSGCL